MLALSPIFVFLVTYLVASIVAESFYAMPISVAFVIAAVYSIAILRKKPLDKRVDIFSRGATNSTTMLMFWIFVLAGAFAETAKQMGAVDSIVGVLLQILPGQMLPASMFIAACVVSMSTGTSVGTIVTLSPIAASISKYTGIDLPMMAAIIVGGAYFGDNLSFISDTTIIATQSQSCNMSDKFKANIWIAGPAAIITIILYVILGMGYTTSQKIPDYDVIKIIPYFVVIATAIAGVNVLLVLTIGLTLTCLIGILNGSFTFFVWAESAGKGILGMGELVIIVLLASGIMGVIKHLGGIDYIVKILTSVKNMTIKKAEVSIIALVSIVDLCTANNTVTLITTGNIVHKIAERFGISPKRAASLLDTSSCIIQGVLPYGMQMLTAAALTGLTPMLIIPNLYYLYILLLVVIISIFVKREN